MIEALEIKSKVIICIVRGALGLYKSFGNSNDGKLKKLKLVKYKLIRNTSKKII
jgi:hypothetical protein